MLKNAILPHINKETNISMLQKITYSIIATFILLGSLSAQTENDDVDFIKGTFLGKTLPARDFVTEFDFSTIDTNQYFEIKNFKARYRTSPVERNLYPRLDALWQANESVQTQKIPQSSLLHSFNGIGFTGVQPPDPCVAASNEYVVQMINGSGGAKYKVWNKIGGSLSGSLNFDNLFSGYSGLGDPIVLFDQLANRWFLSEFSSGGKLLVAVSETNDPLGSYFTYVFSTPSFPDYPKYSVWHDAYYCTANENSSSIYAFQRDSMLVGGQANLIRKVVGNLSGFGFQTLTPVNFEGTTPTTSPATFWRHVDDEAHYPGQADPFSDWVEYWKFVPDFTTPSNSSFLGPNTITVSDFDSDLNGYFAFSAIKQPNTSTKLDPLREVFMNRMNYRNFGLFESLVACHVTDVNGSDWAGMRWYEFRKTDTTNWTLYQEGTYAPDSDSRWMGAIDINANGSICLAYSVSSTSTYPSLRYTGRNVNDAPGVMTLTEQVIVAGGGSNNANRYGDYAAMSVDPADDSTFWFTGEYNPTSTWSTRIAHIQLDDTCNGLTAITNFAGQINCPDDSTASVSIHAIGGPTGSYMYSGDSSIFQTSNIIMNLPPGNHVVYVKDGACLAQVSVTVNGPDSFIVDQTVIDLKCFDGQDGKIIVNASGGTPPLEFSTDNTNWSTSSSINSLSAGFYTIYVKDSRGCTTQKDSVEIVEPDQIIITDSIVPASSSTTADGMVFLTVTGGTPVYSYSKDSLNFQAPNIFTNLMAGFYTFYVVDANNCTGKLTDVDLYSVSVNELFSDENLVVFPNPTTGEFSIKIGQEIMRNGAEITVRDVTGKLIFTTVLDANSSEYTQRIDLSTNAKGVYFVGIKSNNESKTIKVILE